MAADEFGCGMNNDVCAVLSIGRTRYGVAEGIIDNQRNLVLMCNFVRLRYRQHQSSDFRGSRCRWLFVLLNGCANLIQIEYINKCGADSVLRKSVRQQVVGTAVDVLLQIRCGRPSAPG